MLSMQYVRQVSYLASIFNFVNVYRYTYEYVMIYINEHKYDTILQSKYDSYQTIA